MNKAKDRRITILIVTAFAILLTAQVVYWAILTYMPEFVADYHGMALSLSNEVVTAQSEYKTQNGIYARDLNQLNNFEPVGDKYKVGFVTEFSKNVRELCPDCIYRGNSFKLLIMIKTPHGGAQVSSIDNQNNFRQLGFVSSDE